MAGGGVGVVLIDLQPALIHTEIHAAGDHMMTAALPREAQARPENFRDIEQRQQLSSFITLSVACRYIRCSSLVALISSCSALSVMVKY
jgi:hypothetical protein